MDTEIYVIPAAGLVVRDPVTHEPLPAEGRLVPDTSHWRRRLKAGDVTRGRPPKPAPAAKSKEG